MITGGARLDEIAANLAAVEERIVAACAAAGRARDEVTIVAVTKTFPASDVAHLRALGLRDVGENRHQDAAPKVAECAQAGLVDLRWHFVGQLQTNKAGAVVAYADVVHSVDRSRLVGALDRGAAVAGRVVTVLVQVDLDQDPHNCMITTEKGAEKQAGAGGGRGGARPADVLDLAGVVDAAASLELGGVMAVAPPTGDPAEAFARLAVIANEVRSAYPRAGIVSAGMSGDLEAAIRHGATHLRVGTALLGSRPLLG